MEIIFKSHHASVSPRTRDRAEQAVRKYAERLKRAVDAVIRFEVDGPTRRVEIMLHAPRQKKVIAEGRAQRFPAALTTALKKLDAQTRDLKRPKRENPLKFAESA